MPQSLSKVYLHIIFSTKNRVPYISEIIRPELQAYMVDATSRIGSYVTEIYGNPDHVHILCTLPRVISIAQFLQKIKTSSSIWIKTKGLDAFHWQDGYAAFSVSASKVEKVQRYIQNQPIHHQKQSYQDEMREFFRMYDVEYSETFVWD